MVTKRAAPKSDGRLQAALAERDAALAEVARLRVELDALRHTWRTLGETAPPSYPVSSGVGPPPLRYVLVDEANERVKAVLGPVHRWVKSLAAGRTQP